MDHLSLPRLSPSGYQLTIPRISPGKFDDKFDEYPDKEASKYHQGQVEWLRKGDPCKLVPSLQTWLFFGLLGTVFNRSSEDIWAAFSQEGTEGTVATVTTRALTKYTMDYLLPDVPSSTTSTPEHRNHVRRCLLTAYRTLRVVCFRDFQCDTYSRVLLSLSVLGEYLTLVISTFDEDTVPDEDTIPHVLLRAWPVGTLGGGDVLSKCMQDDGWCRKDISRLKQNFFTSEVYFARNCGNPDAHKSHENCTFTSCAATRIPENSYQTKHVCKDGNCDEVVAKQSQLDCILRAKDSIPLISTIDHNAAVDQSLCIDLIKSNPDTKYVAISHIWSEGLGNELQNGLPRCQLLALSGFVKELYDSEAGQILFWIDSICCPRIPDDLRGIAISKMRDTYAKADKVLVLDSWLQCQEMEKEWAFEFVLKVFLSKWNKRLWTLQEGALAKNLVFRFKTASFPYPNVIPGSNLQSSTSKPHLDCEALKQVTLVATCSIPHKALRGHQLPSNGTHRERIQTLQTLRGFKSRDTSHDKDEALCLGALLNLDLKEIVGKKSLEERMATVWRLLPSIPPSLIFSFAPRLREKGFEWAPATLKWSTSALFDDNSNYSPPPARLCTSSEAKGLLVEYPGVLFSSKEKQLSHDFYFPSDKWYRVSFNHYLSNRKHEFGMDSPDPIAEKWKETVEWCRAGQTSQERVRGVSFGLLLSLDLAEYDVNKDCRAILVSTREKGGILFARFLSTVMLFVEDPKPGSRIYGRKERCINKGRNQRWCLS